MSPADASGQSTSFFSHRRIHAMFLTLAIVLFVLWALGFFAFHVTSGLIHIIVVIAVIMLVLHFVRGGRRTTV
jgi:Family of unknown function (DUF5670)